MEGFGQSMFLEMKFMSKCMTRTWDMHHTDGKDFIVRYQKDNQYVISI